MEKSQLNIQECLKHHHPSSNDNEDDAPMAEAVWVFFGAWFLFILRHIIIFILDVWKQFSTLGLFLLYLPLSCWDIEGE
jgi:hypothetical protein